MWLQIRRRLQREAFICNKQVLVETIGTEIYCNNFWNYSVQVYDFEFSNTQDDDEIGSQPTKRRKASIAARDLEPWKCVISLPRWLLKTECVYLHFEVRSGRVAKLVDNLSKQTIKKIIVHCLLRFQSLLMTVNVFG